MFLITVFFINDNSFINLITFLSSINNLLPKDRRKTIMLFLNKIQKNNKFKTYCSRSNIKLILLRTKTKTKIQELKTLDSQ